MKFLRTKIADTYLFEGIKVNKGDYLILMDGENSGETFISTKEGYLGSTLNLGTSIICPNFFKPGDVHHLSKLISFCLD